MVLPLATMSEIIDIPTAHVWGAADPYAPIAQELGGLCKEDLRSEFIHGGGHEVPGAGSKEAVTSIVNVIRRAILLA